MINKRPAKMRGTSVCNVSSIVVVERETEYTNSDKQSHQTLKNKHVIVLNITSTILTKAQTFIRTTTMAQMYDGNT